MQHGEQGEVKYNDKHTSLLYREKELTQYFGQAKIPYFGKMLEGCCD